MAFWQKSKLKFRDIASYLAAGYLASSAWLHLTTHMHHHFLLLTFNRPLVIHSSRYSNAARNYRHIRQRLKIQVRKFYIIIVAIFGSEPRV